MLDKWIITDKEPSKNNRTNFRYTICQIDYPISKNPVKDIKTIYSSDNFNIGDLVNSKFESFEKQPAIQKADIMVVKSACFLPFTEKKSIKSRISFFDPICGDCHAFITADDGQINLERGGMVWADCFKNENGTYSYNLLGNVGSIDPYDPEYKDMPYVHKIIITELTLHNFCTEDTKKIKKHVLAYSEEKDYFASFCFSQDQIEYNTEIGDKLLVKQTLTKDGNPTFNILQNISVDYMRKCVMR